MNDTNSADIFNPIVTKIQMRDGKSFYHLKDFFHVKKHIFCIT